MNVPIQPRSLYPDHWEDHADLEKLAASGEYTIHEFMIAARQVPGYNVKDAAHLEAQWWGSEGKPIPTPEEDEEKT